MGTVATAKTLVANIEKLSTISPIAVQLVNKLSDSDISKQEIKFLIEKDELILANVFKYARSAAFGLQVYPDTIAEAVDVLGTYGLRDLLFSIVTRMQYYDLELWKKTLTIALLSKNLAEQTHLSQKQVSNVYLLALMQFMGELIAKTFYKNELQELSKIKLKTLAEYSCLYEKEKEYFGLSFLEISHKVSEEYGLPEGVCTLIQSQSEFYKSEKFSIENAVVLYATALYELECKDYDDIEQCIDYEFIKKFNLENIIFDPNFFENIERVVEELSI